MKPQSSYYDFYKYVNLYRLDFILAPLKFGSWFTCFFSCTWFHHYCPSGTTSSSSSSSRLRLWLQRRLYQWALFVAAGGGERGGGGAAALLLIICCCSQIDYEVSTQLGFTSSSTHGTGDQLQPWAPAADSKPAVRCWRSTCGSSDLGFPPSRTLSVTCKRVGKTPPVSSAAYSRVSCTWGEPIIIPPRDAQLQAVAESTMNSWVSTE